MAAALALLLASTKLLGVMTSLLVVDRCGRRPLLLAGAALTAASLGVAAAAVHARSLVGLLVGLVSFVG